MLLTTLIWVATFSSPAPRCADYQTFVRALLGPGWIVFEAAYVLFVILILAVFGAAAGAIAASLGLPAIVGTLALMTSIALVVAYGHASVERLFTYVSFLLYGLYALFLLLALTHFGGLIVADSPGTYRGGWVTGGVTYASYNIIRAVVISRYCVTSPVTVMRSSPVIAGPLAMLPALLFFCCMMAYYPQIGAVTLPSDFLLRRLDLPLFRLLFQLMIFAALLESGTGAVHAINERIGNAWRRRHGHSLGRGARLVIALVILTGCMFLAARFGLVALIANGYRLLAAMFLLVYVLPVLTIGIFKLRRGPARQETT
jgi:uncharacterized membrane protein YkvI